MKCWKCGHDYPDNFAACPVCGALAAPTEQAPQASVPSRRVPRSQSASPAPEPAAPGPAAKAVRPDAQERQNPEREASVQDEPQEVTVPASPVRRLGTAPMVLGVVSLCIPLLGYIAGIIAIVLGAVAMHDNPMGSYDFRMARAGRIMGIISCCLCAAFWVLMLVGFVPFVQVLRSLF